jgi:inhibitor of cysteine peptidase
LFAIAVAVLLVACGGSDSKSDGGGGSSMPKVYEAGDSISVGDGDTFAIALDANPSTGYSWEAESNANVEFVKSKQVQGNSNAVGAPGTQQLTFKAVKTGSSTLTLKYLRPFDPPNTAPAQTEDFPVTVK